MASIVEQSKEQTQNTSKIELSAEDLKRIMSEERFSDDDEIDLLELWNGLLKRKWLIIFGTLTIAVLSLIISINMTPKYESTVKMLPVSSEGGMSGMMAKYGGLASLAGISLPTGGDVSLSDEAVEVLKSKQFLAQFILEQNLKPILFAESWDEQNQQWLINKTWNDSVKAFLGATQKAEMLYEGKEVLDEGEPSIYQAVEVFNKDILNVGSDSKLGMYSLTIKWNNPVLARDWANLLVERVDEQLRQNGLQEAQATIDYMNKKLATIQLQDIRNIALQTIEENLKKITFAQVQKEYVFKVIDPAIVAEKPVSPKKGLMVAVGFVLGLMLSIFIALILNWRESSKEKIAS